MQQLTLLFALVFFTLNGTAQNPDPRIFSTWYILEYIEDGVSYFAPDAYELEIFEVGDQNCPHFFYFPNPFHSSGGCLGPITDTEFTIMWLGPLAKGEICQNEPPPFECEFFFIEYHSFFRDAEITGDPLSYVIEDLQNGKKTMVVTNLAGDQAIYSNQFLSIGESSKRSATVYPNPVTEELIIVSNAEIKNVSVYSLHGKVILETSTTIIDLSTLQNGMYFLQIENEDGKEIHKIVKN